MKAVISLWNIAVCWKWAHTVIEKSKQVEPALCEKPQFKAVDLNLGESFFEKLYSTCECPFWYWRQTHFCSSTWVVFLFPAEMQGSVCRWDLVTRLSWLNWSWLTLFRAMMLEHKSLAMMLVTQLSEEQRLWWAFIKADRWQHLCLAKSKSGPEQLREGKPVPGPGLAPAQPCSAVCQLGACWKLELHASSNWL